MLSLALACSPYFVRFYDDFIRQWPEEINYLGVIYILPFCVLLFFPVCCVVDCCS